MMAPRLMLKHSSGWFAAGREVAAALEILSDAAFKLYVHACLYADRQTGTWRLDPADRTRPLPNSSLAAGAALEELCQRRVCQVLDPTLIEICDAFWPYRKPAPSSVGDQGLAGYVEQVRVMFLAPACIRSSFTAADRQLAASFHDQNIGLADVQRALWLGCARKYAALLQGRASGPITSLRYFVALIDEVRQSLVPSNYWEYTRRNTEQLEKRWLSPQRQTRRDEMMET